MYITETLIQFEFLNQILNLPENAKVVAIIESDNQVAKIRIVSEIEPNNIAIHDPLDLRSIGDAYRGMGETTSNKGTS